MEGSYDLQMKRQCCDWRDHNWSTGSCEGAQQADRMESGWEVKTGDSWSQTLLANLPSGRTGHSNASSQETLRGQC